MRTSQSYSRTQIILHWLVAALVLFQIFFHDTMQELWRARMNGSIPNVATPQPHTIVGILIGLLIIWRLSLRLTRGTPPLPQDEHTALKWIATITHWLFYALLLLMALSGIAAWFIGAPQSALAHGIMSKLLIVLVILHFLGAMAQHFWFKTDVLKRILGMA